jgi:hypothetical protein
LNVAGAVTGLPDGVTETVPLVSFEVTGTVSSSFSNLCWTVAANYDVGA